MKALVDFTSEEYFKRLKSRNKFKAIEELALVFKDSSICSNIDELILALEEREEIMSTGVGFGLAIPHAKIKAVKELTFAIGISKRGIDFDSMDGNPVYLIILVVAGERQHKEYLKLLSNIMTVLKDKEVREKVIKSDSIREIIDMFRDRKVK